MEFCRRYDTSMIAPLLLLGTVTGVSPPGYAADFRPVVLISSRALDGDELLTIGDMHAVQRHLQEALPYYQRAVDAYRARHDRRGEAAALVKAGDVLGRLGRHSDAMVVLQRAVGLWQELGQDGRQAQALLRLGVAAEELGRRKDAQQAYERAQRLFQQAQDRKGHAESLIRLGNLKIAGDDLDEGLGLLEVALTDARARRDSGQQVAVLIAIGKIRLQEGEWAAARLLFGEGLRLVEAERNLRGEAELRVHLARLDGLDGRFQDGIAEAQRALLLYQTLRDRSSEADTLSILGWLHQAAGNPAVAADHHQRALAFYRALRDRHREAAGLLNLAAAYEAQGLVQDAQEHRREALSLLQSSR